MTGLRKNLEMSYRGLIQSIYDFPELTDRHDGNIWVLNYNGDIGDIEYGGYIMVDQTARTGTVSTVNQTTTGDYSEILGIGTDFTTTAKVGSKISINNEERYVIVVTDGTHLTLDFPLSGVVTGSLFYTLLPLAGQTVYVQSTHANPIAAAYGKIAGTNTLFTTELAVGDVVLINGLYVRQIATITSDTVMFLDLALDVAVSGVTFQKKLADGFWSAALDGTIATDVNHLVYDNPYYNKVYSANAAFEYFKAGDAFVVIIDGVAQLRMIETWSDSGTCTITEPFYGDLTSLLTPSNITWGTYAQLIANTGNSNAMKILLWTETSSGWYNWVVLSNKNIDGTSTELIPAGLPSNAIATETELTFAGQPTAGKIITFGDDVYEWYANGGSPDPYTDNIDVEIGLNTDGSISNLEAAINLSSSYHVAAVKDLGTDIITITATSLFQYYNDLPTTTDDGNLSFTDTTFGGGTYGIDATVSKKGERYLDVFNSKIWIAKDDNTDIYSLTKYWYYMAIA